MSLYTQTHMQTLRIYTEEDMSTLQICINLPYRHCFSIYVVVYNLSDIFDSQLHASLIPHVKGVCSTALMSHFAFHKYPIVQKFFC